MVKKICLIVFLLLTTLSFAGEYDKDIVVKNQSRNDKVKTVFREMMNAYEEEDITKFFSYVSEDRFEQDYMTFYDAIDEDIRIYDILSIDTWVNKITDDGVKRFLYVQWEKRYESSKPVGLNQADLSVSDKYEIKQRGATEFLFDEINGKYKLIKIAGNNFWGGSLKEWTDEVGDIAGQESKEIVGDNVNGEYQSGGGGNAIIAIENLTCVDNYPNEITFDLVNNGTDDTSGNVNYQVISDGASTGHIETTGSESFIAQGSSVSVTDLGHGSSICPDSVVVIVSTPNNDCSAIGAGTCP